MIERFEQALADRVGAPFVAAVSSGTAGLHLCARQAGIGPGDEVITSPFSFVASANCVLYEGATPGIRGCRPGDAEPRPGRRGGRAHAPDQGDRRRRHLRLPVRARTAARARAGNGLALVEDACQALGAEYRGRPLGSFDHPAVFAFYPNKQVTTGEGGAVAVHREEDWRLLKSLANQGRADSGGWLEHARFGFNYRLDDLSAAVGLAQLEKLDEILPRRAAVAERFAALLADVDGVSVLLADDAEHRRSWFVYPVRLSAELDRERIIEELAAGGIATSRYLPSIHLQPYMRERFGFAEGMCPVSEEASRRLLALPFYTELDPDDQEYVVDRLRAAVERQ